MLFYLTTRSCDFYNNITIYFIFIHLRSFLIICFPRFMVILWDVIVYYDVIMVVARPCDLVVLLDNKVTWLFYNLFYYIFLLFFIDIWGDNSSMCVLYGFYLRVITSLYIVMYPWLLHVHVSLLSTIYICKQTLMYHWRRSYDRKFWFLPLYYFTPESNFVFILIYKIKTTNKKKKKKNRIKKYILKTNKKIKNYKLKKLILLS